MSYDLSFLVGQTRGPWEQVGAALGFQTALHTVTSALSAEQLRLQLDGLNQGADVAGERAEALAAHSVKTLAALAETWPRPIEVKNHPWFEWAWRVSMRHLQRCGYGSSEKFCNTTSKEDASQ